MNTPNQLDQALEALRQEHRSIQPPLTLEASIMRQAELATPRHAHTLRNWSLATAAALAIALVLLYPRPSHPTLQTNITTTPPSPQTAQTPSIAVTPPAPPVHQLASSRPHLTAPRHSSTTPRPFVLLPTGVGLPEPTQAMLIRTRIDTSSLRNYGLAAPPPGAPQTILAEFLVGEDGLPRAIRLVP
jgi:hypothetical protein